MAPAISTSIYCHKKKNATLGLNYLSKTRFVGLEIREKLNMADVTPGSAATITATTAEGQLLELVGFIRQQEQDAQKNPDQRTSVTGTINLTSKTFSGTINLLTETSISSTGSTVLEIKETLFDVSFSPGSGGTFKSSRPLNYLAEVATYLQIKEGNETSNPQGLNYIQTTINGDAQTYTGTFSFPIDYSLDTQNGNICIQSVSYLG